MKATKLFISGAVFIIALMFLTGCNKISPSSVDALDITEPLVIGFSPSSSNTVARSDDFITAKDTGTLGTISFVETAISPADEARVGNVKGKVINGTVDVQEYDEYHGFMYTFTIPGDYNILLEATFYETPQMIIIDTILIVKMDLTILEGIIIPPGEEIFIDSTYFDTEWKVEILVRTSILDELGLTDQGYQKYPYDWAQRVPYVFPIAGNGYSRFTMPAVLGRNTFHIFQSIATSPNPLGVHVTINPDSARVWNRFENIGEFVLYANGDAKNHDTTEFLYENGSVDPVNLGTPLHPKVFYKPIYGSSNAYLHVVVSTMPTTLNAGYTDSTLATYGTDDVYPGVKSAIIPQVSKRALPHLFVQFDGAEAEVNESWDNNRGMLDFQFAP